MWPFFLVIQSKARFSQIFSLQPYHLVLDFAYYSPALAGMKGHYYSSKSFVVQDVDPIIILISGEVICQHVLNMVSHLYVVLLGRGFGRAFLGSLGTRPPP